MNNTKAFEEFFDRLQNPEKYKLIERQNKMNKILDIKKKKKNIFNFIKKLF